MLNISQLENELKPIINNELLRFPFVMQAYIGTQMVNTGLKSRIAPSTNTKLEINTGKLFRSFSRGSIGNIHKVSVNSGLYQLEYGSNLPYARIQEYGGFIRSKGKMHKYFWAKFAETKQSYFKNLALHVEKKGGVTIPKRPYFEPALQRFKSSNKYQEEIKAKVIQGIREWQENQRRSQA
jgi:hypothetical protein